MEQKWRVLKRRDGEPDSAPKGRVGLERSVLNLCLNRLYRENLDLFLIGRDQIFHLNPLILVTDESYGVYNSPLALFYVKESLAIGTD